MKHIQYWVLILFVHLSFAQTILSDIPDKIDSTKQYVIYLHGAIIENGDPKPIHPRYGLYDFPSIQQALATKDIILISEQRKSGTIAVEYANKVKAQVEELIAMGVRAETITVLGFSKGAGIAIITSDRIKNDKLNYAIMAHCGPWYKNSETLNKLRLTGHVLSVYEASDTPGSCENLAKKSTNLNSFKEIMTNTGKAHGTFFQPDAVWLMPVLNWINRKR